ncbi:hypothetical protein [Azospirillum argentinense]
MLALLLTGCGGAHLYDPDKDALGREAKTQFGKASTAAALDPQRDNLKAFAERDATFADQHARIIRDGLIQRALNGEQLAKLAAERETPLGIAVGSSGTAALKQIGDARNDLAEERRKLTASVQDYYIHWGNEPPACDESLNARTDPPDEIQAQLARTETPRRRRLMASSYEDYRAKCSELIESQRRFDEALSVLPPTSFIRIVHRELTDARARLNARIKEAANARDAVAKSERAVKEAAVKAPEPVAPEVLGRAKDFINALEGLDGTAAAVGLGKEAAARKRIQAINTVLKAAIAPPEEKAKDTAVDAVSTEEADRKADILAATIILKAIPTLADQMAALDSDLNAPPISALLIERARQQALLEQAQRTIRRVEDRITALAGQFDALLIEAAGLRQARLNAKSPDAALKRLVDAVYQGERGRAFAAARLNDIDHQMAVDSSQYAYAAYQAVIDTPVNQLAAYHAAGVKPEDLARLIVNGAGLGAIAGRL